MPRSASAAVTPDQLDAIRRATEFLLWLVEDVDIFDSEDVIDAAKEHGLIVTQPHAQPCALELCPCLGESDELYLPGPAYAAIKALPAEVERLEAEHEVWNRERDADYGKIIAWLHAHGEIAGDLDAVDVMIALADRMDAARTAADYAAAEALLAEVERLGDRSKLYNEAVTILLECNHGDEPACGCRDRSMERLIPLIPKARKEQG